jgi:hypothetical protein
MKEDNELIAEYMGEAVENYQTLSGGFLLCVKKGMAHLPIGSSTYPEYDYKNNWNALMPVVEKISQHVYEIQEDERIGGTTIIKQTAYPRTFAMLSDDDDKLMVRFNRSPLFTADTLIEATYNAVVEWIKTNNEQP